MSGRKVAFTALADHGGTHGPFPTDTTLVFNNVITNVGDGYNPCSGVFTAPVAGVYYFTFFFHAGTPELSEMRLVKNGEVVVLSSDKSAPGTTDTAGNAAVLKLQKCETVSVHLTAACAIWAASHATTFSGFLICEI